MTTRTIFVPVLIESVEQAEAMPGGTVAFHGSEAGRSTACRIPPIAVLNNADFGWDTYPGRVPNASMVGWTALAPVEAEEEVWFPGSYKPLVNGVRVNSKAIRLVTPWTEEDA